MIESVLLVPSMTSASTRTCGLLLRTTPRMPKAVPSISMDAPSPWLRTVGAVVVCDATAWGGIRTDYRGRRPSLRIWRTAW